MGEGGTVVLIQTISHWRLVRKCGKVSAKTRLKATSCLAEG